MIKRFYCVYLFDGDFRFLAAFKNAEEAQLYFEQQRRNGTPNLYSKVVEQSVGGLIETLLPGSPDASPGLISSIIDRVAA